MLVTVWMDADTCFESQQQEEEIQHILDVAMQEAEELHRKKMVQEKEGEKDGETVSKNDSMATWMLKRPMLFYVTALHLCGNLDWRITDGRLLGGEKRGA